MQIKGKSLAELRARLKETGPVVESLVENIFLLLSLCFLAYVIEFIDTILPFFDLERLGGIHPRDPSRLHGMVTAHLLHDDWLHLFSNTLPFIILGGFVLIGGRKLFWRLTIFVALFSGGILWLLALNKLSIHIGASMLIFGYLGFLLTRGIFERSLLWIGISIVTLLLYGGLIFGVLPGGSGVSWEGHLYGLISGVFAAKFLVPRNRKIYQSSKS